MNDTIAAISTPSGTGGIGVIRLSGPDAEKILLSVFRPAATSALPLKSHLLCYGWIYEDVNAKEAEPVDECMAVIMRAPRSYTREDVAELQLHGGSAVLRRVLELCIRQGARLADPGEFTRRAFLSGRLDLSRAEAVMSLISARGEQARRAAARQLAGGTAGFVRKAADELYSIQAGIAACVDYPEEVSEEEAAADALPRVEALARALTEACDERAARLLREGVHVALFGRPNAGKSSILNALLGEDRAIVTPVPGTTRDTVSGELELGGTRFVLTDTAGLRATADPVERLGVERSEKALAAADAGVLIMDGSEVPDEETRELMARLPETAAVLVNKNDLSAAFELDTIREACPGRPVFSVSAMEPETLRPFRDWLRSLAEIPDRLTVTQPRHLDAVRRAIGHLKDAAETLRTLTPDVAATDLQAAQETLAEITGDQADERLLDAVFSQFCVGK